MLINQQHLTKGINQMDPFVLGRAHHEPTILPSRRAPAQPCRDSHRDEYSQVGCARQDPLAVSALVKHFLSGPGCQEGSAMSPWCVALKAGVKERLARKIIHAQTEQEEICFQLAEKASQERQN